MRPIPTASPFAISWNTLSSAFSVTRMSSTLVTSLLLMSSMQASLVDDSAGRRAQRQQRKACQPMRAHILTGDEGQTGGKMTLRGARGDAANGIIWRQTLRDGTPAPRAAQIQPVEMHDPAVAAVADPSRREQRSG